MFQVFDLSIKIKRPLGKAAFYGIGMIQDYHWVSNLLLI